MKKIRKQLLLILLGLAALAAILIIDSYKKGSLNQSQSDYVSSADRVTRAEAARMISLLSFTREELEAMERVITYDDTDESHWYDKYINGLYSMNLLLEDEGAGKNEFRPLDYFTYGDGRKLLEQLLLQEDMADKSESREELSEKLSNLLESLQGNQKDKKPMEKVHWLELYQVIWSEVFDTELEKSQVYIVDTWENNGKLEKWQTATDKGLYYGDGINFFQYMDKKYEAFIKGDEILCLADEITEPAQINNVWIIEKKEDSLSVFVNGCTRSFELAGELQEDVNSQVGDLLIEDGKVIKVSIKPDRINGRVLVANDSYLEIEGYGKKALSADFRIYRTYDEISMDTGISLMVGYENAKFVIVGDEICAAIIDEKLEVENIRVLLKTSGYTGYYHDKAVITSDSKFTLSNGTLKKTYKAGKKVTVKPGSKWLSGGRLLITCKDSKGKIAVESIKRNGVTPSYYGTMEVSKADEGLLLVNELPLEQYLYSVIPSEMPTTYGVEALKVQAVCARTYAYKQILANGMRKYGAHVDDSASYQVYNNVPDNKTARKAVDATIGQILRYEGEPITSYYFSTSCGHTANAAEVWNGNVTVPYLTGELQITEEKDEEEVGNLKKEEDMKEFLTEDLCETYDCESAWYRWHTTVTKKQIKRNIDNNLGARYDANPQLILTLGEDGKYHSVPVDTVGTVKKVEITKRKTGGIVTEIIVTGSENTVKIISEYNIRLVLAPANTSIVRQDESLVKNQKMLPSAFFIMEAKTEDKKSIGYTITGGGFGHGVGMSQNGAKGMIDRGYTYEEILMHYYEGAEIGKMY